MSPISTRSARWVTLLASAALVLSAASVQAQSDAADVSLDVTGLAAGDVVTDDQVTISVSPVGYELTPVGIGKSPSDTFSHYHVVLDGALINAFVSPDATVSLQNVAPGEHTLMVVPATNDHSGLMEAATAIPFEYAPESALPDITADPDADSLEPAIRIVSPVAGETVLGAFEVVVETTDFELSGDLFGKPNLDGIGHWHAFIDEVRMPNLVGMGGTDRLMVMTAGLEPGTHTIFAVLVDNLHAPFDPPIVTKVEVVVADDGSADSAAAGDAIAVSLQEWQLDPAELTLEAGTYTFDATNDGTLGHALKISGEGVEAATPDAFFDAGVTQSFSVDLAPGNYEFYCPVAGHKEAGMVGSLTVTG